jgi:hypothetical protein
VCAPARKRRLAGSQEIFCGQVFAFNEPDQVSKIFDPGVASGSRKGVCVDFFGEVGDKRIHREARRLEAGPLNPRVAPNNIWLLCERITTTDVYFERYELDSK